jgi:hypothetical protein
MWLGVIKNYGLPDVTCCFTQAVHGFRGALNLLAIVVGLKAHPTATNIDFA